MMKKAVLMFCLFFGIASAVSAEDAVRPEVGSYVRAYTGLGAKVWLTRIGPRTANQVIVQITGVDHDWDRKIQIMDMQWVKGEKRYLLKNGDQEFTVLVLRHAGGQLYLPGDPEPYLIHYDEELSQQSDAQHFLTAYLHQNGQR